MSTILFPIGRFIGGSLEKLHPRTEQDGKTPKMGSDGKPMLACNFGVAIPKAGEQHWAQTAWGAQIYEIGKSAYPVLHTSPSFAWKIINGDDHLPNKNGKVPNQQTGYAGNWVIWFSQGWLPKLCSADGAVELQPGAILPGQYIQVNGDVTSNGAQPPKTPGVYMNPVAVALAADGERIVTDVDTTKIGFGGTLPAGALPLQPAVAGFGAPAAPAFPPVMAPPAPTTSVVPNTAFMAPPAPPAPPAGPVMTALAQGASYQTMIAAGWTDALLKQHGMMA